MAFASSDRSSLFLHSESDTLKSIIHHLSEGVIIADTNGNFLFFNDIATSILGMGAAEVPVQSWSETYGCYRPDGVTPFPSIELPLARALKGEIVDETEIFVRNQNQPEGVHILVKARPLWNPAGELRGGIVTVRDITRGKEREAKILTLMNAVEQTADSIVITNRNGNVEYVNPAFETTTGYSREEVLGRNPNILKSGVHDASFYRELWDTITAGYPFRATIANRKKNGEIYFAEQTITPMRDSAGVITQFVSVVKDVTEQRKLQEQEAQLKLARAIQQQFYRVKPPLVEGFDIAGAAFPADATGGDYFDFVPLPENCVGLSIGDVCGHGIASALLMVELRACLRANARSNPDVAEVITLLNDALVSDLNDESFATLAFCRLQASSRSLVYANAGHVPGYILDAHGAIKHKLDALNVPLGLFPDHPFFCSTKIPIDPGEILVLLTDGITEAERPDQTQYGAERALQYIRTHQEESAEDIVRGLYHDVRAFADGLPQADDITILICKSL